MRAQSARLMIELTLQRGLRELVSGDGRRAVRSVVEDACHLIHRGYPRQLFAGMQQMFRTEVHPYFELLTKAARMLEHRYFMGFAVNLCYESWIRGTRVLRSEQRRLGRPLPWLLTLDLDTLGLTQVMTQLDAQLPLGVSTCLLRTAALDAEKLLALSRCYPRCALAVLAPDEAFTDAALHALDAADNLLLIACRRHDAFTAAPLLKAHRRLYALCRPLDESAMLRLMDEGDLLPPGDAECMLPMFEPDAAIPQHLRAAFNQWIEGKRQHPEQPVFPIDLTADIARVQALVSEDADI